MAPKAFPLAYWGETGSPQSGTTKAEVISQGINRLLAENQGAQFLGAITIATVHPHAAEAVVVLDLPDAEA